MIERLRTRAQALASPLQVGLLACAVGLLLALAYSLAPVYWNRSPLLPLVYIVAGVASIGLYYWRPRLELLPFLLLGGVNTFSLILLPSILFPNVGWWMALMLVSLLSLIIAVPVLGERTASYALLHLLGALGGGWTILTAADTLTFQGDSILLGIGLLLLGTAVIVLLLSGRGTVQAAPQTVPTELDLNHMVMQLHVTADGLVRAVDAMNHVGSLQHDGASEQAELISRTNELLSDFLELSGGIREQARSITQMAQQAADLSQNGQATIQQAIQGMDEIRAQVSAIAGTILALAQFTQRIDEIITSVSEIATQSNLLALNASIEAARAGVHGRGFAVVADEVRSLSQQSTQAARQVRAILGEIQNAMKETIRATEVGLQGVDAGVSMTQQADNVMVQLAHNVTASHEAVRHIYEVILEQVNGLEEIAISIERIDRITQQNLTSTSTVRTVSQELTRLAADLQTTVGLGEQTGLTESVNQNAEGNSEQDAGEAERDATHDRTPEQTAL
jgi:hypothetical protein